MATRTGQRLLQYDRRLGVRCVAGADEAGRGSLAGPLVVAAVLFDYAALHGHRTRALGLLNDSKQVDPEAREILFGAVADVAAQFSIRIISASDVDRVGLHRSNLQALRDVLSDLAPRADACLVDGFRLGPHAPPHTAVVDGDTRSAAIAAASIVAKVTRDRIMRRLDTLHPQYGFARHAGYITPTHSAAVRAHGPCTQHRLSYAAKCYEADAVAA